MPAAMSDPVNDDCTDLAEARQGHDAAFRRLYDRHAAVVLSLCRRVVGGSAPAVDTDAEDALQETFIRAFRKLDEVHDCRGFRSWLYRIARLVCSEHRRATGRRKRHEMAAIRQGARTMNASAFENTRTPGTPGSPRIAGIPESPATSRGASSQSERREHLALLSMALDRLSDEERLAIHLYYLDSDPVAAAKSALGVGRSGFYKLLARARESLAVQLREVSQP